MQPNAIKREILDGGTVAGAMVFEFFTPGVSAILANAGCRFVIYDMEHAGLGYETLKWLFAGCRGLPIEPMVRVPLVIKPPGAAGPQGLDAQEPIAPPPVKDPETGKVSDENDQDQR